MEDNNPNTTYMNEESPVHLYYIVHLYLIVAFSVICILGTFGNGVVIWFAAFKMKKTVNCVWLLSLAMADFTFCLFLPLKITSLATDWPFGTFMCKFHIFILFMNLFASILHLTIISIDRWITVVFPVWCQKYRSPRLALKVSLAIWILSVAFSLPSFMFSETVNNGDYVDCYDDQFSNSGEFIQKHQVIIRFIIFFVTPFSIIFTCYMVIFIRVRRNRAKTSNRPFKVIAAVIIAFFICWFPYHLFWLMTLAPFIHVQMYHGPTFEVGFDVSTTLAYANSCVNPVLYAFIGRDFKEKCWNSIKPTLERAFADDTRLIESQRNEDSHTFEDNNVSSQM